MFIGHSLASKSNFKSFHETGKKNLQLPFRCPIARWLLPFPVSCVDMLASVLHSTGCIPRNLKIVP